MELVEHRNQPLNRKQRLITGTSSSTKIHNLQLSPWVGARVAESNEIRVIWRTGGEKPRVRGSESLPKRVGVPWEVRWEKVSAGVGFRVRVCEEVELTSVRKSGKEVEGGGGAKTTTNEGWELGRGCHLWRGRTEEMGFRLLFFFGQKSKRVLGFLVFTVKFRPKKGFYR